MPAAAQSEKSSLPAPPGRWLWFIGVTLIVFAGRCREILLYAGDTPYLDQWWVEAHQILVPWLNGKLSWKDFFLSHHEHIPVWTRLLAWLEAAVLHRWDPQVQCTLNALIFGLTVATAADWLKRHLSLIPAIILTTLCVALAILPHGWENSTWGFQSLVPLAILFGAWHIAGSFEAKANSLVWWSAQAAGLAVLFTFGSMWTAPAAVVLTALWTAAPRRSRWIAPAVIAGLGAALFVLARHYQPHSGAFVLTANSPQQFIAAFLVQLGWPSSWPGVALLIYFPTLLLTLQLRRNEAAQNIDRTILALALWSVAQAAAFAYGRGSYLGFVSRYGDLLSVGVVANAIALWRLIQGQRSWRLPLVLVAMLWLAGFYTGLRYISTRAHTEYFHEHAALWNLLRANGVKHYLESKDPAALTADPLQTILYPVPPIVAEALDTPGLAELLPVSLRPNAQRTEGDFVSAAAFHVRDSWPAFAGCGALLLVLGLVARQRPLSTPITSTPWLPNDLARVSLVGSLAILSSGLFFLWPMPWQFHPEERWRKMILPPDAVGGLTFKITTPSAYPGDRIIGAAALSPVDFRNSFFGTHVDGPPFTGRAESSAFPITTPWLVIPYAGFPASAGNALSLQISNPTGQIIKEITCPGPNPEDIDFWNVDVAAYAGQQAKLIFVDGRSDEQGWLAAGPPQATTDARRALRFQRAWKLERTLGAHLSLAVIAGALILFALGLAWHRCVQSGKLNHGTVPTAS